MAHQIKPIPRKNEQDNVIIDMLAKFLSHQDRIHELSRKYHKIFTEDGGVILKYFAKKNNFKLDHVQALLKTNLFFKLGTTQVVDSFFSKQVKELTVVHFTDNSLLEMYYRTKRIKLIMDAEASDVLLGRLLGIMRISPVEAQKTLSDAGAGTGEAAYQRPKWSQEKLFSTYYPNEYDKYRRESKLHVNIEKRFHSKLHKQDTFIFENGMEANSLVTWFQCLLISEPGIIHNHLLTGDFERWLRNSVKERELANICSNLARKIEELPSDAEVTKREILKRLRRTSYEGSIYNTLTKPLIKKLKSADASTVQQTADKLMELGDERAVESLIEKLFDSVPTTRKVVMNALVVIGDPRAINPLIKIFEHGSDTDDRLNALKALGKFEDERCLKIIARSAAEDKDEIGDEARRIIMLRDR